jgi:hypothetical protein
MLNHDQQENRHAQQQSTQHRPTGDCHPTSSDDYDSLGIHSIRFMVLPTSTSELGCVLRVPDHGKFQP